MMKYCNTQRPFTHYADAVLWDISVSEGHHFSEKALAVVHYLIIGQKSKKPKCKTSQDSKIVSIHFQKKISIQLKNLQ